MVGDNYSLADVVVAVNISEKQYTAIWGVQSKKIPGGVTPRTPLICPVGWNSALEYTL